MSDEIDRRQALADKIRGDHMRTTRRGKSIALIIVACAVIASAVALIALRENWISSPSIAVPQHATEDFGFTAPLSGTAADVVEVSVYESYVCSSCQAFHTESDAWLTEQLSAGTISVTYYPVTLVVDPNTADAGERTANAATCVADEAGVSAFISMRTLLLTHSPADGSGLTDDQLIAYATEAGAPGAQACIEDLVFVPWLTQARDAGAADEVHTLPTVRVDGLNVVKTQDGVELMPGPTQLAIAIEAVK